MQVIAWLGSDFNSCTDFGALQAVTGAKLSRPPVYAAISRLPTGQNGVGTQQARYWVTPWQEERAADGV